MRTRTARGGQKSRIRPALTRIVWREKVKEKQIVTGRVDSLRLAQGVGVENELPWGCISRHVGMCDMSTNALLF